jgi:hypothetical protein
MCDERVLRDGNKIAVFDHSEQAATPSAAIPSAQEPGHPS